MPSPHPVAERLRALASGSALAAIGCFSAAEAPRWAGTLASHLGISWANASESGLARVSLEGTVPLSEHERRQLEQIEAALREGDPRFADAVRAADPRVHYEQFRGGAGWPFGP